MGIDEESIKHCSISNYYNHRGHILVQNEVTGVIKTFHILVVLNLLQRT